MNLVIATDNKYAMYYEVVLTSFLENNLVEKNTIYLLYTDNRLSVDKIEKLKKVVYKYGAEIVVLPQNGEKYQNFPIGCWSIEMWYRLLLIDILPLDVKRVLWLDGDTLVIKNICDFYYQDIDDYCFAACEDLTISRGRDAVEMQAVGLKIDQPYVNTGVLLINLDNLRRQYTIDDIVCFVKDNMYRLKFPDQSLVNAMFHQQVKICDEFKYNCINGVYSYTDSIRIEKDSCIIHFAGSTNRPWKFDYQRHYCCAVRGEFWWQYAKKCGYRKEYIKWKMIHFFRVRIWQFLYNAYRRMVKSNEFFKEKFRRFVESHPALCQKMMRSKIHKISYFALRCDDARMEKKISRYFCDNGLVVMNGPFKGMRYPDLKACGSTLFPKLAGTYENELQEIISIIIDTDYKKIIDVGCAEGYYAVGFAYTMKNIRVYGYDIDSDARNACKKMAQYNNISDRLIICDWCLSETLEKFDWEGGRGLIVCDCEGFEKELFTVENIDNLKNVDILVEIHDYKDIHGANSIYQYLLSLFSLTHNGMVIKSRDTETKIKECHYYDDIFSNREKYRMMHEGRVIGQEWIWFQAKQDIGE